MSSHQVDQADLQGNVLCGYGDKYRYALYLFLRVTAGPGRRWLKWIAPRITSAADWGPRPPCIVNVAFTFDGLRAMGVPQRMLATFPAAFAQGMAARAQTLGDIGESSPATWEPGLREHVPHVVVTLFALDPDSLTAARGDVLARVMPTGSELELVHEIDAQLLDHPAPNAYAREHFGFADGLSQPSIAGNAGNWGRRGGGTPEPGGRWSDVAPGEFVLGYSDEDGLVADAPTSPLRRSGSYTVVRKLHQHVGRFNAFLESLAADDATRRECLAAKIVGRWRDGTPLSVSPSEPRPDLVSERREGARVNDFRYEDDPEGMRCPIGAHVRRANPRDALGWDGRLTKRHRIIRRGMPYGPRLRDGALDDGEDRGLVFVCHQASVERQFELIQRHWVNDGDAFELGEDRDLLTGTLLPGGKMTIQGERPVFLTPLEEFVTMRGGGYFFTPGLEAVRAIAAGYWI